MSLGWAHHTAHTHCTAHTHTPHKHTHTTNSHKHSPGNSSLPEKFSRGTRQLLSGSARCPQPGGTGLLVDAPPTPVCDSPHCNQQQPCQLRARKAIPEAAESAWPRRGPVGAATEGCLKAALSPTAAEGGDTGQGQPRTQQDSGAPLTPPSLERARKAEALGSAGNAGLAPGWEGGSSLQPGMLA